LSTKIFFKRQLLKAGRGFIPGKLGNKKYEGPFIPETSPLEPDSAKKRLDYRKEILEKHDDHPLKSYLVLLEEMIAIKRDQRPTVSTIVQRLKAIKDNMADKLER
jgi:hypothetical protein